MRTFFFCLIFFSSAQLAYGQKVQFLHGLHFAYGLSSIIGDETLDNQKEKVLTPSHGFDVGFDTKMKATSGLNLEWGLQFKVSHFSIDSLFAYSQGSPGGAPFYAFYYQKKFRINYLEIPVSLGYQLNLNMSKTLKLNSSLGATIGFRNFISKENIKDGEPYVPEIDRNKQLSSFTFSKIQLIIDKDQFKNFSGTLFCGPKFEISNIINRFEPLRSHGYKRPWNLYFQLGVLF